MDINSLKKISWSLYRNFLINGNIFTKTYSSNLKKRGYALINLSNTFTTRKEFIYILLFAQRKKNIKIIQVGANDGKDLLNEFNNDYRENINYIGIEPQQKPFNKLKETYKNFNNFFLVQECVGIEGKSSFYYFNEKCKNININFTKIQIFTYKFKFNMYTVNY